MKVVFHPDFSGDLLLFIDQYSEISDRLGLRFKDEVLSAMVAIKTSPTTAGHFVDTGSAIVREVRRRNLPSFPFFILYGLNDERLIFGTLIPSSSDPLTWFSRLSS